MPDENRFAGLSEAVEESEEPSEAGDGTNDDGNSAGENEPDGRADEGREERRTTSEASARNAADDSSGGETPDGIHVADRSDRSEIPDTGEVSDIAEIPDIVDSVNGVDTRDSPHGTGPGDYGSESNGGNRPDAGGTDTADHTGPVDGATCTNTGDRRGETSRSASSTSGSETSDEFDADPAFGFDATKQRSLYVRPHTWQQFDDLQALVDARLRTEHGVRDLTGREFQDAALRVAAEHEEELVEAIVEARREES